MLTFCILHRENGQVVFPELTFEKITKKKKKGNK